MPKREPYTCSVCKKVHIGANCWSTDSDEEIDSGLLKAMRKLVPKEFTETVDEPQVSQRQSRAQSVSSIESWERGDSSSLYEEPVSTPLTDRQATTPLLNQRQESKASFIDAVGSDANAYRQQSLTADDVRSHGRIASGTQERRQSGEHQLPTPRNYVYSQISALPQPLRIHDHQAQRQDDAQHRRSDEYKKDLRAAQQHEESSSSLQQEEAPYQPLTDSDHSRYQQIRQEEGIPPPRREQHQYPSRASHERIDPPQTFRNSQEAMDHAARQRVNLQPNHASNPQGTPTFTQPRNPPPVPTRSGSHRIELPLQNSRYTQIGTFIEEGKKQYHGEQEGLGRSDTQQRQTIEQDRQRGDQRVREDSLRDSGGRISYHAQARFAGALEVEEEVEDDAMTEIGDIIFAANHAQVREHGNPQQSQLRKEDYRRRGESQQYPELSGETARPIGEAQRRFQREEAELAALRERNSRHNHGSSSSKRREDKTHRRPEASRERSGTSKIQEEKTHRRPDIPHEHPSTQRRQEKTMAEEGAYAAHNREMQRQQSNSGRRKEDGTSQDPHQTANAPKYSHKPEEERYTPQHGQRHDQYQPQAQQHFRPDRPTSQETLHARAALKVYHYHDRQIEDGIIAPSEVLSTDCDSPGALDHPSYKNVLPRPALEATFFFKETVRLTEKERREKEKRQTHWEFALGRLEGRIPDDVEGGYLRKLSKLR